MRLSRERHSHRLVFASPRTSAVVLIFTQKAVLDLCIDLVQPLLRALGLLPVCFNLSLELRNAILGSAKLVWKPLRRIDRVSAVLLGNISSFVEKLEDRLTGFVELSAFVSRSFSRSPKWYHFGTHCWCLSLSDWMVL
jgi:hypothetical protein